MRIKKFFLRHSADQIFVDLGLLLYSSLYVINKRVAYTALKVFATLLFASPGLTFTRYGYDNIYATRLCYLVQEKYRVKKLGLEPVPKRTLRINNSSRKIRVGVFGSLSTPHKDLFMKHPENVDLYVYDTHNFTETTGAPWLESFAYKYYNIISSEEEWGTLVEQIKEDQLDILVHFGSFSSIKDVVISQVDTPRILVYNTGTAISFSEKVDFDFMHQPQLYCSIKDDLYYCDIINLPYSNVKAVPFEFVFNHRNLDYEEVLPLSERKKQIVYHGNLYKLDNKHVLRIVAKLLKTYPEYQFVFMGNDQKPALKHIMSFFKKVDLLNQVHYLGNLSNAPDRNGNYKGNDTELFKIIMQSKLYIDPWPIDGGNTVFQAYGLGVPCVSLKMDKKQPLKKLDKTRTIVELSGFVTKLGPMAKTPKEYEEACFKILEDENYAQEIIEAQICTAKKISGEEAFKKFWDTVMLAIKDDNQ